MDDDPIGDALAMALEAIEEHSGEERYRDPMLAARIKRVQRELEELQFFIDDALFSSG
jgi:hypothetical protein